MFELSGYTVDGVPAHRPEESMVLYRGSVPELRKNWSWTDSRAVAEKYADGEHYSRPLGRVWTATVEPWRLMASNRDRAEREYVVDTDGLAIHVAPAVPKA